MAETEVRQLHATISELTEQENRDGVSVEVMSPKRRQVTLWEVATGEEVSLPLYQAKAALARPPENGKPVFTERRELAAVRKANTVKCFMHEDAPERDILLSIGINKRCPNGELASDYSKQVHAQHRHKQEWAMYQEYVKKEKEARSDERQQSQIDATLALAGMARGNAAPRRGRPPK